MDDLILRDYAAWKMENKEVLDTFIENDNPIYFKLQPIYLVLDFIYDKACNEEIDIDHETIFQVGFNYLHSQFEVIKVYYSSLFKSNCDDFIEYSEAVLYLLYIFDVRSELETNGFNIDYPELDSLESDIENAIAERSDDVTKYKYKIKDVFDRVFTDLKYNYVPITDVFVEIAYTLGIFEEDEVILGTDI